MLLFRNTVYSPSRCNREHTGLFGGRYYRFKFESLVRLERKDFYDIAVILEHHSLREMVSFYKEKYPTHNVRIVFDNLLRFREAENTPSPNIVILGLTWESVTKRISNAFSEYKLILLEDRRKLKEDRIRKAKDVIEKKSKRKLN